MHKAKELTVYCCTSCFEVQVKTITPKIKGCKRASFHNWLVMGEKGLNKYACEDCGVRVNTTEIPVQSGCKEGKNHNWKKK